MGDHSSGWRASVTAGPRSTWRVPGCAVVSRPFCSRRIASVSRLLSPSDIERARAKGVTFGRKRKLDAEMIRVAAERYAKGETMAELADVYGVSEPTIWRALQ
jgi:hypothetical protein